MRKIFILTSSALALFCLNGCLPGEGGGFSPTTGPTPSASPSPTPTSTPFAAIIQMVDKNNSAYPSGIQLLLSVNGDAPASYVTDVNGDVSIQDVSGGQLITLSGVSQPLSGVNAFAWQNGAQPSVSIVEGTTSYSLVVPRVVYTEYDSVVSEAVHATCDPSTGGCGWLTTTLSVAQAIIPSSDLEICTLGIGISGSSSPVVMGILQGDGANNSPGDGFVEVGGAPSMFPVGTTSEGQSGFSINLCTLENVTSWTLHKNTVYWVYFNYNDLPNSLQMNGYTSNPNSGMGLMQAPDNGSPWSALSGLTGGMNKFQVWLSQ